MIGNRLKRARESKGLSLRQLAVAIQGKVSAQAIGKYERDEMMPGSETLLVIADALDISPEYLLSQQEIELTGVDFRKEPQAGVKEERAVEAAVLDQMERFLALEDLMPDSGEKWHVPSDPDLDIQQIEDAERAADALRRHWKLGVAPIPSMAELLEERGIKVIALELPEHVSGSKAHVNRTGKPEVQVVVVNKLHNGERQRFTMAHELAHLALSIGDIDEEKVANRFAGAFLVPTELLVQLVGTHRTGIALGELAELKKLFKVSIASLVVRCAQAGIISKATYGRLFEQIKELGWNVQGSPEPNRLAAEIPQRMERLCFRAVAEGAISESRAAELLKISVRELDRRLMGFEG